MWTNHRGLGLVLLLKLLQTHFFLGDTLANYSHALFLIETGAEGLRFHLYHLGAEALDLILCIFQLLLTGDDLRLGNEAFF